jgi:hypothetical protein
MHSEEDKLYIWIVILTICGRKDNLQKEYIDPWIYIMQIYVYVCIYMYI